MGLFWTLRKQKASKRNARTIESFSMKPGNIGATLIDSDSGILWVIESIGSNHIIIRSIHNNDIWKAIKPDRFWILLDSL